MVQWFQWSFPMIDHWFQPIFFNWNDGGLFRHDFEDPGSKPAWLGSALNSTAWPRLQLVKIGVFVSFFGGKFVPKPTSNHSASWIGFKNAERSESFLKGHTVSDFTFLMANSSCLGSANLCRLLHWLENHRKSPGSWPQFLHPHHISIAKVGQNWQRSSHDQAWHYSQSSQPVQRQQIQAVSRCFIIVGAKTRPTRPSHLFIIAAIFIGGLQSALDLKGWHLDRKVQETHETSRNIFQNLASLRIFCEFLLSTCINCYFTCLNSPPKTQPPWGAWSRHCPKVWPWNHPSHASLKGTRSKPWE